MDHGDDHEPCLPNLLDRGLAQAAPSCYTRPIGTQKLLSSFFGGKKAAAPSPLPATTTAQVPIASTPAAPEQAGPSTLTSYPSQATTQPPPEERAALLTFG
ncbi:hypothetical protein PQX77_005883 [Marasmius sp. AFHP31]|nr:hypothetical protein PQX77_005883 [Marasmius sp. AFHP31]